MILEADLGNTRLKWRLQGAGESVFGVSEYSHLNDIPSFPAVTRVKASAVVSDRIKAVFVSWCIKRFGVEPEFARSGDGGSSIKCAYWDVSSLGVDRWLAMLSAHKKFSGAVIVVDCGTATTVDVLDDCAVHKGGYILPGFNLMHQALGVDTANVVADSASASGSIALGANTQDCVSNGILMSIVSLLRELLRLQGGVAQLVITGGAGRQLLDFFSEPCWEEFLVLDGLALALP